MTDQTAPTAPTTLETPPTSTPPPAKPSKSAGVACVVVFGTLTTEAGSFSADASPRSARTLTLPAAEAARLVRDGVVKTVEALDAEAAL